MQWHYGGPNLHPAPCGGFIAGMNTVICQGRAAQLRWGLEGSLGTWNEGQELMAAATAATPFPAVPGTPCHWPGCPMGTPPPSLQWPKALGAPAEWEHT